MIGKLRGIVDAVGKDWVIVDVGGVGYEVWCPARTLSRLPTIGQPVTLIIETHVREDAIKLFGFLSEAERSWFRLLQNVQGVGTKVALSVLGVLEPQELANAIALQDKAQVARAPGVGPKVAQRIVSELRDKAPGLLATGDIGPQIAGRARGSPGIANDGRGFCACQSWLWRRRCQCGCCSGHYAARKRRKDGRLNQAGFERTRQIGTSHFCHAAIRFHRDQIENTATG